MNDTLNREEIEAALRRLGELADQAGLALKLQLVGGGAMVLAFGTRQATHDVDVKIESPRHQREAVLALAAQVAAEQGWPADWLNDEAAATMWGSSHGPIVLRAQGIEVELPSLHQFLAMKLSAFRGKTDQQDAERILQEIIATEQLKSAEALWKHIRGHISKEDESWAYGNLIMVWQEVNKDSDVDKQN